ncbi:MAG: Zn-dependent exopeptidase M28 [Candidatus Hydrogenedens sp.]|jgi:hypothetical protein|nr:Zn-dependent exopeptidase M28 [Candidatus Hydrogenedens sp.]
MEQIKKDLEFLSRRLKHRSFATLQEKEAADYLLERLKPLVAASDLIPFDVVSGFGKIKAAYVTEFFIVSLLAIIWPGLSFFYGLFVFVIYLSESFGYPLLSRLMQTERGHAVGGGINQGNHKTLLVFTAYLDSAYSLTSHPLFLRLSRYLELAVRGAMVLTLASCALDMIARNQGGRYLFSVPLHWSTAVFFLFSGVVILLSSFKVQESGGANHNASGMAALLRIAEKLQGEPVQGVATMFYLPGGHHANSRGMQFFLSTLSEIYEQVFFINLESVGAGELCYSASEGVLHSFACSSRLVEAADACASGWAARKVSLRSLISNAYLPLMQGYEAISLVGLDEKNRPLHYKKEEDIVDNIDMTLIEASADLAIALARRAFSPARAHPDFQKDGHGPV